MAILRGKMYFINVSVCSPWRILYEPYLFLYFVIQEVL